MSNPISNWDSERRPSTVATRGSEEEALLKAVKEVMNSLKKALKVLLIYPQNSPLREEFRKNFHKKLQNFLEENEELTLEVHSDSLLRGTEAVYVDQNKDESLAFQLHKDGLRRLSFMEGITDEESGGFLDLVIQILKEKKMEDDLVTLLWIKDYPHIKYLVVDDFLEESAPSFSPVTSNTEAEFEKMCYSEIALGETQSSGAEIQEEPSQKSQILETDLIQRMTGNLDNFAQEEIEEIDQLLKLDLNYNSSFEAISILFEILNLEEDLSGFTEVATLLEKVFDTFLIRGDLKSVCEIIESWQLNESLYKERSRSRAERLRLSIDRAGDKERLSRLSRVLNDTEKNKKIDPSQVFKYLTSLSTSSISSLTVMLGELSYFVWRKTLCEALAFFGKNHPELVGNGIFDKRWFVVRNVALILGRTGNPKAVDYLKKSLTHPDIRVRKETVVSLAKLRGEKASQLLTKSLNDPDRKIRILATKALIAGEAKEAIPALMELVQSKKFKEKNADEKIQILLALTHLGQAQVIPFLKKLVKKKNWWNKASENELKQLVIKSFENLGTEAAWQALQELSRSHNKIVKQACLQALSKKPREDNG